MTAAKNFLKSSRDLAVATVKQGVADDIPRLGAALAFYAMLSIVPMMVLLLALGSFFYGHDVTREQIHTLIFRFAGMQEADAVQGLLDSSAHYAQMSPGTAVFSAAILLYGASAVFNQLQDALNFIWCAPPRRGSAFVNYIKQNIFSFFIVCGIGVLLIASVMLDAVISFVVHYAVGFFPVLGKLAQIGALLFGCGAMTVIFAFAFKYIPDTQISWRDVWPGALVTAIFSTLGQFAIGFYLGHSTLTKGYGAGGSLVALLIWLYYFAQIFFFGAIFTRIYAMHYGSCGDAATA